MMQEFRKHDEFTVTGTALRRSGDGLDRLDLCQEESVRTYLAKCAPDVIIHSAAERFPDVCENDLEATTRLNVDATRVVAECARDLKAFLIYLSTDYVFDGTSPPYFPDSKTNPLNNYARSKRDGELAVRDAMNDAVVLRVPLLYGPTEDFDESPVTAIAGDVVSAEGKEIVFDDWATRYPTYTEDVAVVLRQLVQYRDTHGTRPGPQTFHWSGDEPMTKFGIGKAISETLGVSCDNLVPNPDPPPGAPRPRDCHLDTAALDQLGIGQRTPFRTGVKHVLKSLLSS